MIGRISLTMDKILTTRTSQKKSYWKNSNMTCLKKNPWSLSSSNNVITKSNTYKNLQPNNIIFIAMNIARRVAH